MPIYKVVLALLLLLPVAANAQAQNDLAMNDGGNKYVENLISEKVDTIAVLSGTYFRHRSEDVVYIFFKKDGQTKVYNEGYGELDVIAADSAQGMWDYMTTNFESLKTEKLKEYAYIVKVKGKNKVHTPYSMDADWLKCGIYLNGQAVKYTIAGGVITKTTTYSNGKKETNINYEYNMKAKRKLFMDMLGELAPE